MKNKNKKPFTDPGTGTSCEGARSGRCSVEEQRRPGRNHDTDPNLGKNTTKEKQYLKGKSGLRGKNKEKWTKEELLVMWECHLRSEMMGGGQRRWELYK